MKVEAICYWWSVAASYQVMLPPSEGHGVLRFTEICGSHIFYPSGFGSSFKFISSAKVLYQN